MASSDEESRHKRSRTAKVLCEVSETLGYGAVIVLFDKDAQEGDDACIASNLEPVFAAFVVSKALDSMLDGCAEDLHAQMKKREN